MWKRWRAWKVMISQAIANRKSNAQPGCSMNRNRLARISRTIGRDGRPPSLSRLLRCKQGSRCTHVESSAFGRINGGLRVLEGVMASHYRERSRDEANEMQATTTSSDGSAHDDRASAAKVARET